MSKCLGGIIDCKYKTSSWHLNGFPDDSNIVGSKYNTGEKPTVILYTYINRHAGTPDKNKTKQKQHSTTSNMVVIIYCFIGCKKEKSLYSTWYLNGFLDGSNLGSTA